MNKSYVPGKQVSNILTLTCIVEPNTINFKLKISQEILHKVFCKLYMKKGKIT